MFQRCLVFNEISKKGKLSRWQDIKAIVVMPLTIVNDCSREY